MFKRLHKKVLALIMVAAMLIPMFAVVNTTAQAKEAPAYRNVMYYGDWSIWGGQGNFYPKDIPADQITHLNFAFLYFDQNGNLKFTDKDAATGAPVGMNVTWGAANAGLLNAFQELRAMNPNLKIGVSIGGWSKSNEFSRVAANDAARANFVSNVMKFIKYNNMDFVDIDWEYPGANQYREPDHVDNINDEGTIYACAEDKENYIKLMQDLRNALDKQGKELGKTYELSCALPAPSKKLEDGVDIEKLFKIIDFGNMMTYDMRGAWDSVSGHQTPLYGNPADPYYEAGYSVDQTVTYLLEHGAPAEKIVIGCAFYSRGWNKVAAEGTVPGMPGLFGEAEQNNKDADQTPSYGAVNEAPMKVGEGGRAGGVWSYRSLDNLKGRFGMKEYWDDVAKAPYMYDEKTGAFFTYDNVKSVTLKTQYVKEHGLGGCISWMASQDKPTTSSKRDELTKTIKQGLFGSEPLAKQEILAPTLDISSKVSMFDEPWGANKKGYEITLKNNETKNESGEVLQLTELAYETIKSPKLYIHLKEEDKLSPSGYGCGTVTNKGNVVEVDLATVYDNQTIGQGTSIVIQLASANPNVTLDNIEYIELAQRITKDSVELGRQVIYGEGSTEVPTEPEETDPVEPTDPTETDPVDPTDPTETDPVDPTDPTETDPVDPTNPTETDPVDPTNPTETDPVDPIEPTEPAANEWSASKTYVGGDVVTHNGKTYEAKWWTMGEEPGASQWGPWKEISAPVEPTDPIDPIDPTEPTNPVDPSIPEWSASDVYTGGAKVIYKGVVYQAQWWTQGEVPGASAWGAWKVAK